LVDPKELVVTGKIVKIARPREEWYEDVEDPAALVREISKGKCEIDIFSFWQRLPETRPIYDYHMEWDSIAALPIKSFDHWWEKQINPKVRNMVRKASKRGIRVRMANFDDDFVKGMTDVFNETPIRQGKRFWHYGKDFSTIKREFSRNLHREDLIGAYFNDELVGFIMLAYAGEYAVLGQIISKIKYRDKAPNNALISKAVEVCDQKEIPYLVYAKWDTGTLGDFKRYNGFQKIELPRYYLPLTITGRLALQASLHHGIRGLLPEGTKRKLKKLLKSIRSGKRKTWRSVP